MWIITIVVVDDTLRYHTREVIGGDRDGPSTAAVSRALYTDGFDVGSDVGGILGGSTTWTEVASAAATCAALLTSWVSSGRSHRYL